MAAKRRLIPIILTLDDKQVHASLDRVEAHGKRAASSISQPANLKNPFNTIERQANDSGRKVTKSLSNPFNELDKSSKKSLRSFSDSMSQMDRQALKSALSVHNSFTKYLSPSFFSSLASRGASAFTGGLSGMASGVTSIIGGALSVAGGNMITSLLSGVKDQVAGAIKTGFDFNRIKEQTLLGFEIKLKGREKAEEFFTQIVNFAKDAEQELPQVLDSTQRLMSAFDSKQALQSLSAITDRVAAIGKTGGEAKEMIDGIGLALQQMIFKGKVSGQEIAQLAERQVTAWKYLGDEIGRTDAKFAAMTDEERIARVGEMAEKGLLNAKTAAVIIIRGMEKEFGGTSKRIARETLSGIESNTSDRMSQLSGQATKNTFESYKQVRQKYLDTLNSETGESMAKGINDATGTLITGLEATLKGDLKSLGMNAFSSAAEGVKGAGKFLYDAGASVFSAAEQGWRDEADQNSPSKVMLALGFEAGQSLMFGFVQGANDQAPRAQMRRWTQEQIDNAKRIIDIGKEIGASDKQIRSALSTGIVESRLRNLIKPVDHDSRGIMQQRPSQGWGTVAQVTNLDYAIRKFYEVAMKMDRASLSAGTLAARVQRPRKDLERRYAEELPRADQLYGALSGASGGSYQGGFGAQGRAMEMPDARPFTQGRGLAMPVYVVNAEELKGLKGRNAKEHDGLIEQTKVPVYERGRLIGYDTYDPSQFSKAELGGLQGRDAYDHKSQIEQYNKIPVYDQSGLRVGFDAIPPGEMPVIDRSTQSILNMIPSLDGVRVSLGQTSQAINQVGVSGQDAFGNLSPLINTAAQEAKETAKEIEGFAEDVGSVVSNSLDRLYQLDIKGFFGNVLRGYSDLFQDIIAEAVRSKIKEKLLSVLKPDGSSGSSSSGGFSLGNILGSVKSLFGFGGKSSAAASTGSALTGGFAGGASPAAALLTGGATPAASSLTAANVLATSGGLFGIGAAATTGTAAAGTAAGVGAGGAAAALGGGGAAAGAGAGAGSSAGLIALASNPITIAIAAAAVGGFLLWRRFRNSTEKKLRAAIRSTYGVDIKDMKVLSQIKAMGEQAFGKGNVGKHLMETIRLDGVKELITNYAEQTGQQAKGLTTNAQYADPDLRENQFIRAAGGEMDSINAGRASVPPAQSGDDSSSSSMGSRPSGQSQQGGLPSVMVAAYTGALQNVADALNQFRAHTRAITKGKMLEGAVEENPEAVVNGFNEGLSRGHKRDETQTNLGFRN